MEPSLTVRILLTALLLTQLPPTLAVKASTWVVALGGIALNQEQSEYGMDLLHSAWVSVTVNFNVSVYSIGYQV